MSSPEFPVYAKLNVRNESQMFAKKLPFALDQGGGDAVRYESQQTWALECRSALKGMLITEGWAFQI